MNKREIFESSGKLLQVASQVTICVIVLLFAKHYLSDVKEIPNSIASARETVGRVGGKIALAAKYAEAAKAAMPKWASGARDISDGLQTFNGVLNEGKDTGSVDEVDVSVDAEKTPEAEPAKTPYVNPPIPPLPPVYPPDTDDAMVEPPDNSVEQSGCESGPCSVQTRRGLFRRR